MPSFAVNLPVKSRESVAVCCRLLDVKMVAALLRCHHRLDTVIQCVCAAPVGLPACLLSVVLLRYLRPTLQHFTAFNSNPFDTY